MTRAVGSIARAVMVAGILGALAAVPPVASASATEFAQAASTAAAPAQSVQTAPQTTQPSQAAPTLPAQTAPRHHRVVHSAARTRTQLVETMISQMRQRLRITQAEQPQFAAVADVMRTNAKTMETLLAERANDTDRSAVDSLRWYERLTEAHADALKNFVPAFATLYQTLSASQRKAADAMFAQLAQRPFSPTSR